MAESSSSESSKEEKDVLDATGSSDKTVKENVQNAKRDVKIARNVGRTIWNILKAIFSIPVVGPIIIGVIVLIIVIIGFYYFFSTMPGLMMGKLKAFGQSLIDRAQSLFENEAQAYVNDQDVAELANYLEEMGYDLAGYGFVVPYNVEYLTYQEVIDKGYDQYSNVDYEVEGEIVSAYRYYKYNDNGEIEIYEGDYYSRNGILTDNVTGESKNVDQYGFMRDPENDYKINLDDNNGLDNNVSVKTTKLLRTYLLADYRIDVNRNGDDTVLNKIYSSIKTTFGGYDSAWAKGLIKFYHAENGVVEGFIGHDSIKFNDKTLYLQLGWLNNKMEYDIDGWADRYGTSLEFLLSLHLATGAPDLVYAMLQSFDTEVQVYLDDSGRGETQVESGYVDLLDETKSFDDMVTWDMVNEELNSGEIGSTVNDNDVFEPINGISINRKVCQYLLRAPDPAENDDGGLFISPDNCRGIFEDKKILYGSGGEYDSILDYGDYTNVLEYYDMKDVDEDLYNEMNNYGAMDDDYFMGYYYNNGETEFTLSYLAERQVLDDYEDNTEEIAINECGYGNDATIDIKTKEYLGEGDKNPDTSSMTSTGQYQRWYSEVYYIERTKTVRTWENNVDTINNETGETVTENVEFRWITYEYNIYYTVVNGTTTDGATCGRYYYTNLNSDEIDHNNIQQPEIVEGENYEYISYENLDDPTDWGDLLEKGDNADRVVVEWIERDKTYQELANEDLLDENGNVDETKNHCSNKSWSEQQKCCSVCHNYVYNVVRALTTVSDGTYKFMTPYIARVLGSWFRDTYFVIPEDESDTAINDYIEEASRNEVEMQMISNAYGLNNDFVVVDEDYLAESKEYWTKYKTKEGSDEYQLYYLNPDGTTSNTTMEEFLVEENFISSTSVSQSEIEVAKEAAEEAGNAFVKKAITTSMEYELSGLNDVVWSAYYFSDVTTKLGWEKIEYDTTQYEEGEEQPTENRYINYVYDFLLGDEETGGIKNDDGGFYYQITASNSIEQKEDAKRSQTNPTIKWLFKYRKYYLYDGSTRTAEAIAEDKENVIEAVVAYLVDNDKSTSDIAGELGNYGRSALRQAYRGDYSDNGIPFDSWYDDNDKITDDGYELAEQWLEWQLDMYYSKVISGYYKDDEYILYTNDPNSILDIDWSQYGLDRENGDPRDPNLIGTVNITKNSLNAFSILENTQTLAAEYSYRDFKELIVELDYFDKEDLSDKVGDVLTWLIPDIDITGWPISAWDEQDVDYGALVESQNTYEYLKSINYNPDSSEDTESDSETEEETDDETESTEEETTNEDEEFLGYEGGECVASPVTGKVIESGTHNRTNVYTGNVEEVGYIVIETMDSKYFGDTVSVDNNSNDSENAGTSSEIAKGLNLFYDEYEDVCAGCTITIDGFSVDINTVDDDGYNGKYEANTVAALMNSNEKEKREKNEELKENAPFMVTDGEDIYIKEGKYIGTTYQDGDIKIVKQASSKAVASSSYNNETGKMEYEYYDGSANYMRIIMTNKTDGTNIDNVSEYFKRPEAQIETSVNSVTGNGLALSAITEESSLEEKELAVMNYFIDNGFSIESAAGIVGNLMVESSLDPTAGFQSGNYKGLAQWDPGRWQAVESWINTTEEYNNHDESSFEMQVRAVYECPNEKGQMTSEEWNNLASLTGENAYYEAAEMFCALDERATPGTEYCQYYTGRNSENSFQVLTKRREYAKSAYELYTTNNN